MSAQLKTVEVGPFDGEDQPSRREWFLVETKDGEYPRVFPARDKAEAYRAWQDFECKTMAPHRLVRLVEDIQP